MNREVVMLSPELKVRGIRANSHKALLSNFQRWNFYAEPLHLYYSLASLYDMPIFSFKMIDRAEQLKLFRDKFNSYVTNYDLGIDMDAHEIPYEQCYIETKRLKDFFDEYKIPYSIRFTGSGFHFNVSGAYIPSKHEEGVLGKVETCKRIVYELSVLLNLTSLDKSIYDIRRIWRMPYSLHSKTNLVCLPLTDEQFENFNKDMALPENVVKLKLWGRGDLSRPGDIKSIEKLHYDICEN